MSVKIRVAKSEIQFYINKLLNQGYKKKFSVNKPSKYVVILEKENSMVTVEYTINGWLSIF